MTRRLSFLLVGGLVLFAGTAAAARLAVTVETANIRSGPGTGHEILWQAEKYYPLDVLERSGKWCRFRDFEGDTGWVHDSLVGDVTTVITTKSNCNIRSGPGTENPVVFSADRGVPFRVLEKKGDWLRVRHADGDGGWIHRSLVW